MEIIKIDEKLSKQITLYAMYRHNTHLIIIMYAREALRFSSFYSVRNEIWVFGVRVCMYLCTNEFICVTQIDFDIEIIKAFIIDE